MVSVYKTYETKKLIIGLLKKEGIDITDDNIKIWHTNLMRSVEVKLACDYVKSKKLPLVLVYTNRVPMKSYIQEKEGVRIFDQEDLEILAIMHDSELLEHL